MCENMQRVHRGSKKFRRIRFQTQYGKLPSVENRSDEVSKNFAGPFEIATSTKKYLIVSTDSKSGCPYDPAATSVLEFLKNYIALFGVLKRIRTDAGSPFRSDLFRKFCQERLTELFESPIGYPPGNGKIGHCNRTIAERLRTNKRFVLGKDNTVLY